jgi:hypothetical protein
MLTLTVKQNIINPDVYMGIDTITSKLLIQSLDSLVGSETIGVQNSNPTVVVAYNDIDTRPQESFTYVDAGLYNQEGVVADAQYYNTASWDIVWVGGFA